MHYLYGRFLKAAQARLERVLTGWAGCWPRWVSVEFVYALIQSVLIPGICGAAALLGLFLWEARAPSPMVPLSLFRSIDFVGANVLTLLLYFGLNGVLSFFR